MANPLFNTLGGSHAVNDGGFSKMMDQLTQFRNTFTGNAKEEVQRLLNSGQMSQAQFNQLGQMANQIMAMSR